MTVSVIIPAYNAETTLGATVASALAQTHPPDEIVIVDDGSNDGTYDLACTLEGPIRVFRQQNAGPSAARNRAIREANGDLLAFLDADDLWLPEKLEKQLAVFDKFPAVGIVCANQQNVYEREARLLELSDPESHAWSPSAPGGENQKDLSSLMGRLDSKRSHSGSECPSGNPYRWRAEGGNRTSDFGSQTSDLDPTTCESRARLATQPLIDFENNFPRRACNPKKNGTAFLFDKGMTSALFISNIIYTQTAIIKKDLALGVGLFDESISIGEDLDLWFKISMHTRVAYIDEVLCHRRVHENNITGDKLRLEQGEYTILKRWYARDDVDWRDNHRGLLRRRLAQSAKRIGKRLALQHRGKDARAYFRESLVYQCSLKTAVLYLKTFV